MICLSKISFDDPTPIHCPMGMSCSDIELRCVGESCAAMLQVGQNEGVCGMVPGALDVIIKKFRSVSDIFEDKVKEAEAQQSFIDWLGR